MLERRQFLLLASFEKYPINGMVNCKKIKPLHLNLAK